MKVGEECLGGQRERERKFMSAMCNTPLCATDSPPTSQLLRCSRGFGTQQLLFFFLDGPTGSIMLLLSWV